MEIIDQPVTITDRAREEISDTLAANKIPETYGVRVGIRGGGCSGTFVLGFDTQNEHDQVYTINEVKVLIDRRQLLYVIGAQVDFIPSEGGYTIQNTSIAGKS
jgi:iron-sulfur cluster assembly protein